MSQLSYFCMNGLSLSQIFFIRRYTDLFLMPSIFFVIAGTGYIVVMVTSEKSKFDVMISYAKLI